jgi:hypothetical protein
MKHTTTTTSDDVLFARYWFAVAAQPSPLRAIFLECERFFDARTAALSILGVPEVEMGGPLDLEGTPKIPAPRYQIRWVGSAARRVPDLRMQLRKIEEDGSASKWSDLR